MTAIVAGTVVGIAVTIASLLLSGDDASKLLSGWPPIVEAIGAPEKVAVATETDPPRRVVDQTLERLWVYAVQHPDNPYIQELYLKALRVAEYYAAEADDGVRASLLAQRFGRHAGEVERYRGAALERTRMLLQLLERSCLDAEEHTGELRRVAERHPESEAIAEALVQGFEIAHDQCGLSY
jgi:hypothetical protein